MFHSEETGDTAVPNWRRYLPRFKNVLVPSLPNASLHGPIHTARYHLSVFARLRVLPKGEALPTREALRDMKDDMVAGVFPF